MTTAAAPTIAAAGRCAAGRIDSQRRLIAGHHAGAVGDSDCVAARARSLKVS